MSTKVLGFHHVQHWFSILINTTSIILYYVYRTQMGRENKKKKSENKITHIIYRTMTVFMIAFYPYVISLENLSYFKAFTFEPLIGVVGLPVLVVFVEYAYSENEVIRIKARLKTR